MLGYIVYKNIYCVYMCVCVYAGTHMHACGGQILQFAILSFVKIGFPWPNA